MLSASALLQYAGRMAVARRWARASASALRLRGRAFASGANILCNHLQAEMRLLYEGKEARTIGS